MSHENDILNSSMHSVKRYWMSRKIQQTLPFELSRETWKNGEVTKIFVYYLSYTSPKAFVRWQRTDLEDPLWSRKSLPRWMDKNHSWLYIPCPWSFYRKRHLIICEGIPDTLTWWELGLPAIGMKNSTIVNREDAQAELMTFLQWIEPSRIYVSIDPDFPNFYSPSNDIVRVWYNAFYKNVDGFIDRRRHERYYALKKSYIHLYHKLRGEISIEIYRSWKEQCTWELNDINALWQVMSKNTILSRASKLMTMAPEMPPLLFPKRKQYVVVPGSGNYTSLDDFIRIHHLEVTTKSEDWYRVKCPVSSHKSEKNGVGALAIIANHYKISLKCHAGCPEDDVLTALGMTRKDLLWKK